MATLVAVAALALPATAGADHAFVTEWGAEGAGDGEMVFPSGIDTDALDNVYVADFANSRIQKFSSDGEFVDKWGTNGSGNGEFNEPVDVAVATDGSGSVYVADRQNERIQKFTAGGGFVWARGDETVAGFVPSGVATDSSGHVYVSDLGNDRIQKFDEDGNFVDGFGSSANFASPAGIDVSGSTIYVADSGNHRIQSLTTTGTFLLPIPALGPLFSNPSDVAVSEAGNLVVADTGNNRIVEVTTLGAVVDTWPPGGTFSEPLGVATGSLDSFFVADTSGHKVQKFGAPPDGSTVRVSGTRLVFEGDGFDSDAAVTKVSNEYRFTDTDTVTAGAGCAQNGSNEARCDPPGVGVTALRFAMGAGNDEVTIGAGVTPTPTLVDGGAGNDILTGASGGSDVASYASAVGAVTVALGVSGTQATGGAGIDTLSGFEGLAGGDFDDTLVGDADPNTLAGGGGDDVLRGDGGNDVITGGTGTDRADYSTAPLAVAVDLSNAGPQATGGAGTDTVSGVEDLSGSAQGDVLTGSSATNTISGGDGDDDIRLQDSGADHANCGAGADTVTADSLDTAAADCETVTRPSQGGGGTTGGGTTGGAPAGPGSGPTGGGGTPGPPVITGLGAAKLRSGKRGSFRYTLSQPARVTLTIQRPGVGRKSGSKCMKQTRKNRKRRKCTLLTPMGKLTHAGKAGSNTVPFSGKSRGKALKRGSYRLTALAQTATGVKSAPVTVKFTVTR